MARVKDKIAIVTGAASGLGRASALRLHEEGATVVLCDVNEAAGRALAAELERGHFVAHDVAREAQWVSLVDDTLARFGRLDILVNNAGIVELADIENTTEQQWRKVHAVGTDGTFFGCKHALRVMRATGTGSIINMSSTAALVGHPRVFAYAASKGAIRAMSKAIAVQCAQQGLAIRCNSVYPGNMHTPMIESVAAQAGGMEAFADITMGQPLDVANMVLFLASDESRYVSGAEMVVDNTVTSTEGQVPRRQF